MFSTVKAEAPVFWSSGANRSLGKVPDAGKCWGQKEKRESEDTMTGWCHQCNGHEFGPTPGNGEGQGGLACCSPWDHLLGQTLPGDWPIATIMVSISHINPHMTLIQLRTHVQVKINILTFKSTKLTQDQSFTQEAMEILLKTLFSMRVNTDKFSFSFRRWWMMGKPGIYCSPWGHKESERTEQLNNSGNKLRSFLHAFWFFFLFFKDSVHYILILFL